MGLANTQAGIVKRKTRVEVISRIDGKSIEVEALILNRLTGILPSQYIQKNANWDHLDGLTLADPRYLDPAHMDMILGADKFGKIILKGLQIGSAGSPIAQNTIFGWIISGEVSVENQDYASNVTSTFHSYLEINDQIKKFWEIEEINDQNLLTSEDKLCEEFYVNTVTRRSNGRYEVRLPFKDLMESPPIGRSRYSVLTRFKHLERKFEQPGDFDHAYSDVIKEYFDLNHATLTTSAEIENMRSDSKGHTYYKTNYLPHHAVYKDSTTTKLRVVFDASSKTSEGSSLNEWLMTGPKLQDDLLWILIRWRKYRIVFTADIEKMYRQIFVNEKDAEYQRILWRTSPNDPIQDYKLLTVTFGTTSAPYLAIRTLQQLARDEKQKFPLAAEATMSDFYVDDCLTGADTIEEGLVLQRELKLMLACGGYNLRKWAANRQELLANIPEEDRELTGVLTFDVSEGVKTLGINWFRKSDKFKYKLLDKFEQNKKLTKRIFLSNISKIFDPLGFLAPFTIKLKILMQIIWLKGKDWDELVPAELQQIWFKVQNELSVIENIEIPRWLGTSGTNIEIHGFCDSSTHAYAAVLYVTSNDQNGS